VAGVSACDFDREFLGLLLVHILEVSAEDSTLGECLGAVRAVVWLFTIVLSQVDLHVATLGKCLSTAVNKTFEESLLPVSLRVVDLDGLTHLSRDGFVPLRSLLLAHVVFFVIAAFSVDVVESDSVIQSLLSCSVTELVASWGQNRSGGVCFLLIRKYS